MSETRHDSPKKDHPRFSLRLAALRVLAWLVIVVERLTVSLWQVFVWGLGFAGLWLFQIPHILGTAGAVLTVAVFVSGLIFILWRRSPRFILPNRRDIDRRLETDSRLLHRPLSQSADTLANPQKDTTRALWSIARTRQMDTLPQLRPPRPRALLAQADPMALRILVVLAVICGVTIAGSSWPSRLHDGLVPFSWPQAQQKQDAVTVWITPPAYTGVAEIVMSENTAPDAPITVPAGSTLKIHARTKIGTPVLIAGDQSFSMENLGDGNYGLVRPIPDAEQFKIRWLAMARMGWHATIVPDTPPVITAKGAPDAGHRADVQIPVTVHDDYGVETLGLTVTLAPSAEPPALGADYTTSQTIMSPPGIEYEATPSFDLTWHPWAGLPVHITLTARDHLGQVATLAEPIAITLPERTFRNPLARSMVGVRKRLIRAPDEAATNVAYDLQAMAMSPSGYRGDPVVFLGLRSAAVRLMSYPGDHAEIAGVASLLWDMALHIEDGNITMTYRTFKDAQKALQDALKNPDTTDAELAQLADELRAAMQDYMQEIVREMQKNMAASTSEQLMSPDALDHMMNSMDLSALVDQMMAQALSGDRKSAQDMLNDLQKMMDSIDPSASMEMPKDIKDMMEALGGLQSVIEKQETLLRETQDAGANGGEDLSPKKDVQDSIRDSMRDIMLDTDEAMGRIPEPMGEAAQFMRMSSDALATGDAAQSIHHQEDALDRLRQQQKQLSDILQQRLKQMTLMSFGGGGVRTDPLGRPIDGENGQNPFNRSRVKIPDESERRRVYNLMQELRKKSGELTRPDYELEYFQRLMRQF